MLAGQATPRAHGRRRFRDWLRGKELADAAQLVRGSGCGDDRSLRHPLISDVDLDFSLFTPSIKMSQNWSIKEATPDDIVS
jgi:hypothetical protein